ncbi:DUF2076 domain-containing protein [Steroidobacter cummioxidans]|uniref:DUF2076 domain-containing protein n=1 Tax=Steroidobacter cummioxidans TaxID=1803913 RepID=UPI000E322A29|nr:DUF2076 domain-containing protein [Steroidobacter cummioxidans]
MENQDQQIIQGLFTRLGEVERQAPPRDAAAEALIKQRITEQPAAPYFMAQTIVMQEQALQHAQAKIEDLERQARERPAGGGLFGGLFGGGQSNRQPTRTLAANARPAAPMQPGQSGGFLAGAAQTAMGVAGGVLLGNAIAGMFAGDAKASEAAPAESADEPAADEGSGFDDGFGDDFGGGDF